MIARACAGGLQIEPKHDFIDNLNLSMTSLITWNFGECVDLGHKIKEVLDRRKQGIVESGSLTEEGREALVKQLMILVARLEEEMFQAEAHKFEAEVSEESNSLTGDIFIHGYGQ